MQGIPTVRTSRRRFLGSAAALASLSALPWPALAQGETTISFLDPQDIKPDRPMVKWETLNSWITPVEEFFFVGHYGYPETAEQGWTLQVEGLVNRKLRIPIEELKKRPKRQYTATLECSGNGVSAGFLGGIGNGVWTGTPLAPLLKEAGLAPEALELVFFGTDEGTEKIRGGEYKQNFGRSLTVAEAMKDTVLLAWELNGKPLDNKHGGPLRLVVPGWYGVAWVKWLNRIEALDRRFEARFMGRDYVTLRGEERGGETIWRETSVGRMNLKSIVGRVTRSGNGSVGIMAAAWSDGTPIRSVELRIDDGEWRPMELVEGGKATHAWKFYRYNWTSPAAGEHTLVTRATDARGRVQPAKEDPAIKLKKTYWEANQQYPRKIAL